MRSGWRRLCLQSPRVLLRLFWFASLASVHVSADSLSETGTSASDWEKIFQNDDVCGLQRWMDTDCNGGGGANARRYFSGRDDASTFTATLCTCTIPYYNIWCGCNLLNNKTIENTFVTWTTNCGQNNISVDQNTTWLHQKEKKIPAWAYTSDNNGTFNYVEIREALPPPKWSIIQIIAPVIVGLSIIVLLGMAFLYWRHYHLRKSDGKVKLPFLALLRSLFKRRAPSVVRRGRNETWVIDGQREQVVNESGDDTDSFFMVHRTPLVESPTAHEVSRWSATNLSTISPPDHRTNPGVYSSTYPQNRSSIEHRMLGTSTIRSFGERVKDLLPWVGPRPLPINSVHPARDHSVLPGNRSTRTNTGSTFSTRRGKRGYETISEVEEEEIDPVGTGRTTRVGNGRGAARVITEEERTAVAGSVILIGDQDFTIESGSTGSNQLRRSGQRIPTRATTEDLKSPPLNFSVEPPSPSAESMLIRSPPAIPISPGAPPLLPPAPRERPPPPPPTSPRATPRRSPSPHLRISTQFDDNPLNILSNKPDRNKTFNHKTAAPNEFHSTSQIPLPNPQAGHHEGPLASDDSNTGTNALSYATLPGVSHSRSRTSFDSQNTNDVLTTGAPDAGHRSASGPRPLPSPPTGPPGSAGLVPGLVLHKSDTSAASSHVPSGAMTNVRPLFSSGDTQSVPQSVSQQSEFDPYIASGIPRPVALQPNRRPDTQRQPPYVNNHQRTVSDTSLPRAPGDTVGHSQRGWSADDDVDYGSLLDHPPMEVGDGMSGSKGVYIAAPVDVSTLGVTSSHHRAVSSESFATIMTDFGTGEFEGNSHRFSSGGEFSPQSPTLSMLQSDPRKRANYVGRRSISGSSGWDVSTQMTHGSPIDPPPLPTSRRSPNSSSRPPALNIQTSPGPSHARLGSDTSLAQFSRSREDILNPARNDPVRLFPASVRAAGYTTGLAPESVPAPVRSRSHTPRPSTDANMNSSVGRPGNGHSSSNNVSSASGILSSGAFSGYTERGRTQAPGGGTWGTESSGIQSIFESMQQLPDVYPHGASSNGLKRTP